VQRLFSTFPEGWPGAGLAFLRVVAAIPVLQHGTVGLLTATPATIFPVVSASAATLLLVGLWTPVAGVLMAFAELILAFARPGELWIHIVHGALGAALAMLGPGAWSVDARLFGRKRIQIPRR
jgi:putative oxidoreductase